MYMSSCLVTSVSEKDFDTSVSERDFDIFFVTYVFSTLHPGIFRPPFQSRTRDSMASYFGRSVGRLVGP